MSRRKTYPIPADPSCRLSRALATARKAALELAETPWLRDYPATQEAFHDVFHMIARCQGVHTAHHEPILAAGRVEAEETRTGR